MVKINDKITIKGEFACSTGETFSDKSFSKGNVILYFYPKDLTSGCTLQACSVNESFEELKTLGFKIYGISPDDMAKHNKFKEKHSLEFPLIEDKELALCNLFGVYGEKKMCGKTYMGVNRTTFILKDGVVKTVIEKVNTKTHGADLLNIIKLN